MDKQVIISMGDFKQIENVYKKLDKVFYNLEHLSEDIEDDNISKKLNYIFKDLKDCIDGLGSAIK